MQRVAFFDWFEISLPFSWGQIGGKHTASAVWYSQWRFTTGKGVSNGATVAGDIWATRPRLTQSLKDSDHVVRRSAAVSLGRIGQLVWREASWKSAWSVPQEHCKKSGLHVGLCLSNVGGYFAPTFTILGLHVGTILGLCWAILAILRSVSVLAFILDLGISVSLSFGPWQAFANNTVDTKKNVFMVCSTIFSFPLGHAALRPCWPYLKLICCVLLSPLPLWSVAGL